MGHDHPTQETTLDPRSPVARVLHARELEDLGELDLATLEEIRLLADPDAEEVRVFVIKDLAEMRYRSEDLLGAMALLHAALALAPNDPLLLEDIDFLEKQRALSGSPSSVNASTPTGVATTNPWVRDGLMRADSLYSLQGKQVLEVGGCIPMELVREVGVSHWTACDLHAIPIQETDYTTFAADARALPFSDESFDAALSICAFEHFADLDVVLREVYRVLRPGSVFFAQYAPMWSCSIGHHVWIQEEGRNVLTFNDPVFPRWGHLLLEEHELEAYLRIVLGEKMARRVVSYAYHSIYINRLFEGDFRRILSMSPFRVERSVLWGGVSVPPPRLHAALQKRHPQGGDFASHGLSLLLRKPAATEAHGDIKASLLEIASRG